MADELVEALELIRRQGRTQRIANTLLFIFVALTAAVMVWAATPKPPQKPDPQLVREIVALREQNHLIITAQIKMLDYLASDHPPGDSVQLLKDIRAALEAERDVHAQPK